MAVPSNIPPTQTGLQREITGRQETKNRRK